jgi:hypothetical protein
MDMNSLDSTSRARYGHLPAAGPHPDQLALVGDILDDQGRQPRKHGFHKIVKAAPGSSWHRNTLRHHRKSDRAVNWTDPADEWMRTSPSYRRTGQETDMDMTVKAIGAVVAGGLRDAGSRKLFICN